MRLSRWSDYRFVQIVAGRNDRFVEEQPAQGVVGVAEVAVGKALWAFSRRGPASSEPTAVDMASPPRKILVRMAVKMNEIFML